MKKTNSNETSGLGGNSSKIIENKMRFKERDKKCCC